MGAISAEMSSLTCRPFPVLEGIETHSTHVHLHCIRACRPFPVLEGIETQSPGLTVLGGWKGLAGRSPFWRGLKRKDRGVSRV